VVFASNLTVVPSIESHFKLANCYKCPINLYLKIANNINRCQWAISSIFKEQKLELNLVSSYLVCLLQRSSKKANCCVFVSLIIEVMLLSETLIIEVMLLSEKKHIVDFLFYFS